MIDTPGVRSFGLSHVTRENIVAAFADLDELTAGLPARLHATRPGRRTARSTWPWPGATCPARGWSRSVG